MTQVADDIQKTIEVRFVEPLPSKNLSFKTATKTKSIQAKPLSSVVSDKNILTKFLLDTLEGKQAIQGSGQTVVCLGVGGDVWQQKASKLLQKYTVVDITEDGWLVCEPKPENEVWATEYNALTGPSVDGKFSIFAQWGERIDGGQYAQTGIIGVYFAKQN